MKQGRGLWIAIFLLGLGGLIFFLYRQFPGALSNEDARMDLFYSVLLLTLIASSVVLSWREQGGTALKYAVIWLGIAFVIVVLYSYRDAFTSVSTRVRSALLPNAPVVGEGGMAMLSRDVSGHFHTQALINGTRIKLLVDTGASNVVLSARDAQRIGLELNTLSYTTSYMTANGPILAANVILEELTVGDITMRDVPASVSREGLDISLLGMSFLNRLGAIEIRGDSLILRR